MRSSIASTLLALSSAFVVAAQGSSNSPSSVAASAPTNAPQAQDQPSPRRTPPGSKADPIPIDFAQGVANFSLPALYAQSADCVETVVGASVSGGNDDAVVTWVGGDGGQTAQRVYVAYSGSRGGIIVAHQGTNNTAPASAALPGNFNLTAPDPRLGVNIPGSAVYGGFQVAWAANADETLAQVKELLVKHANASILVTGHSMGGAIATIDALFLSNALKRTVKAIAFAPPRVGNAPFADFIDKVVPDFRYIVNGGDPTTQIVPATYYRHPSGEVWINPANSTTAVFCPGQENVHCQASLPQPSWNEGDHLGVHGWQHVGGLLLTFGFS
ncbi:Alpha/Beta hydrolase protein [Fimicolochytrium jonesii]|uniref:Alpha/Beta hydrolase protein n=1 Tax=Fimicolochytrium jonesii TaxID=1396493 RepID=UPI0022FDD112|nr:Alpha/Beta hydrolase protein [Fimicolochytrium jonesii]KAI8820997.1 Alpha/Beta hydrolase protein [Fimicolochytrium jonesii]